MGFFTIAKIAGVLVFKAFDLHASGADVKIIDAAEELLSKAHGLLHKHEKRFAILDFHQLGKVAHEIFLKAFDLHESGEDTKIVDEVHDLIAQVYDILNNEKE